MLETLIWLSAALALFRIDRTVAALLASLLVAEAMARSGMPFHPVWWALLDAAVFLIVARKGMPWRDVAILALFLPAWCGYLLADGARYFITALVVIAQFIITYPFPSVWRRIKATPMPCIRNPFDMFEVPRGY